MGENNQQNLVEYGVLKEKVNIAESQIKALSASESEINKWKFTFLGMILVLTTLGLGLTGWLVYTKSQFYEAYEKFQEFEMKIKEKDKFVAELEKTLISKKMALIVEMKTDLASEIERQMAAIDIWKKVKDNSRKLANVRRTNNDLYFEGVNVHIRNSKDKKSENSKNGLGNLFVGFNDDSFNVRTSNPKDNRAPRNGVHNVVVGRSNFSGAIGCLLIGENNRSFEDFSFVCGNSNDVFGRYSAICGGQGNVAKGKHSTVCGGEGNSADTLLSSIHGGSANKTDKNRQSKNGNNNGRAAAVFGGREGMATGHYACVVGGLENKALSETAVVVGGSQNTAGTDASGGNCASVVGGSNGVASGKWASVLGGSGDCANGESSVVVRIQDGVTRFRAGVGGTSSNEGTVLKINAYNCLSPLPGRNHYRLPDAREHPGGFVMLYCDKRSPVDANIQANGRSIWLGSSRYNPFLMCVEAKGKWMKLIEKENVVDF